MDEIETLVGRRSSEIMNVPQFRDAPEIDKETIAGLTYIGFLKEGAGFVVDENDLVDAIHLHSEGHEGYSQYSGKMPGDLNFAMSQQAVRAILKAPAAQGHEGESLLGRHPAWDVFRLDKVYLHVGYSFDCQSIELLTLSVESPALS